MRSRKILNKKTGRYVSRYGKIGSRIIKSRKSYKIRKSPDISATLFPVSTYRTGNDGNTWTVRKTSSGVKKWIRV